MYHGTFIALLGIYKNKFTKLVTLHCPTNGLYVQQITISVYFSSNQYEQNATILCN